MRIYCYAPTRPVRTGNVPPCWVQIEPAVLGPEWPVIPEGAVEPWGVLAWSRELTDSEVREFSLQPLGAREMAL